MSRQNRKIFQPLGSPPRGFFVDKILVLPNLLGQNLRFRKRICRWNTFSRDSRQFKMEQGLLRLGDQPLALLPKSHLSTDGLATAATHGGQSRSNRVELLANHSFLARQSAL
jgi:hypothetical protein